MISTELILDFRDFVNSNDWTLFRYKDIDNRNKWNCICSAMDWIEVAAQYLESHSLSELKEYDSIDFYAIVSCIDIIVEAIEQLNRVINPTKKQIFEKDRDCFPDNRFHQCDKEYFKNIRAWFGAHPVNLDEPTNPNNNTIRRFASWSKKGVKPGTFSIVLYSNQLKDNVIIEEIAFSQLSSFAEKYYQNLHELKSSLKKQYTDFCAKMKKKKIHLDGDPVQKLSILQEESKKRLDNSYYSNQIDEMIRIFSTTISCTDIDLLVENYRNHLLPIIDEIRNNLQNMTLEELSIDVCTVYKDIKCLPMGWDYYVNKLSDARLGGGYPAVVWSDRIRDIFSGRFVQEYESFQELYLLVRAALFEMHEKEELKKKSTLNRMISISKNQLTIT